MRRGEVYTLFQSVSELLVQRLSLGLTQVDCSRSQSSMELCRLFRGRLARSLFPVLPHESTTLHSPLSPFTSCICACRWRSASLPLVRDDRVPNLCCRALHDASPATVGRARHPRPYYCRGLLRSIICCLCVHCSFNIWYPRVCFSHYSRPIRASDALEL